MLKESQYKRPPSPKQPASVITPSVPQNKGKPPYPDRPPGPSLPESFMAGYGEGNLLSKNRLTAEEWYDLNHLSRQEWLAKYPDKKSHHYTYWAEHARKRQRKMNQPNWLERAIIPPGFRNYVPPFIRAII